MRASRRRICRAAIAPRRLPCSSSALSVADVSTLPNVTIGVLPFRQEAALLYTNGFTIFEGIRRPFVLVESLSDDRRLDDELSLSRYRAAFEQARQAAVVGAEATVFLRALMADLSV